MHALLKSKEEPAGPNFFADAAFDRPGTFGMLCITQPVLVKWFLCCLILNLIFG